jgi:predicted TIM-barrel enzyme
MQGRGLVVAVAIAASGIGFGVGVSREPAADAAGIQKVQDARVLRVLNQINRKPLTDAGFLTTAARGSASCSTSCA